MRRVIWLGLIGAVCAGCGKKPDAAVPDVAIEPNGPQATVPLKLAPPPTFDLPYGQLWDPKGAEKTDPVISIKAMVARRYFVKHQTEFLAPATVGSFVSLAQGGPHGVVVPAALASAYPSVAEKFEADWENGLTMTVTSLGTPLLDFSTSNGSVSSRVLVLRVKDGTDDELRLRFDEYAERVEKAVKATGATTAPQRGAVRPTGALSDIRYEVADHTGSVRSVVVREFDAADAEFAGKILGEAKGDDAPLFKAVMGARGGPFLVVALRDQRR